MTDLHDLTARLGGELQTADAEYREALEEQLVAYRSIAERAVAALEDHGGERMPVAIPLQLHDDLVALLPEHVAQRVRSPGNGYTMVDAVRQLVGILQACVEALPDEDQQAMATGDRLLTKAVADLTEGTAVLEGALQSARGEIATLKDDAKVLHDALVDKLPEKLRKAVVAGDVSLPIAVERLELLHHNASSGLKLLAATWQQHDDLATVLPDHVAQRVRDPDSGYTAVDAVRDLVGILQGCVEALPEEHQQAVAAGDRPLTTAIERLTEGSAALMAALDVGDGRIAALEAELQAARGEIATLKGDAKVLYDTLVDELPENLRKAAAAGDMLLTEAVQQLALQHDNRGEVLKVQTETAQRNADRVAALEAELRTARLQLGAQRAASKTLSERVAELGTRNAELKARCFNATTALPDGLRSRVRSGEMRLRDAVGKLAASEREWSERADALQTECDQLRGWNVSLQADLDYAAGALPDGLRSRVTSGEVRLPVAVAAVTEAGAAGRWPPGGWSSSTAGANEASA